MTSPIDFYFDFSSPYGYFAAQTIEGIATRHGRRVQWHPILLGVVFKATGAAPLVEVPLKSDYAKRDFARSARFHGLPVFELPPRFPIPTQAAARIALWTRRSVPDRLAAVCLALYHAYFRDHVDISAPDAAAAAAATAGVDAAAARRAVDDPVIKDALKVAVEEAMARGVFGSPFFIVDGEPFWGVDRMDQLERWFETGGF